jgi:hypothetical protein
MKQKDSHSGVTMVSFPEMRKTGEAKVMDRNPELGF